MPAPPIVQRVSVGADVPLLEQVRGIKRALEEAVKQAKWRGGGVQVDVGFHIGVLTLMEKIVGRVEALEGALEEEDPLVAVD